MASIVTPNYTDDQDKTREGQLQKTGAPQVLSSQQSASSGATQGIQQQPASSGRFTNIQSYLGANKNAGTQIGSAVNKGVSSDINKTQEASNKEAENFRAAVDASKNTANQAQNLVNQASGNLDQSGLNRDIVSTHTTNNVGMIGASPTTAQQNVFDPNAIINDPSSLSKYTGLTSGTTAANTQNLLNTQGANAVNAAQNLSDKFNQRLNQVNNTSDRFGLLKEFIGNPRTQYGSGLSSLDNAFLQRDPNKTLQTLQQNLTTQRATAVPAMAQDVQNLKSQASQSSQSIADLGNKLKDQSVANEGKYYDYLSGLLPQANTNRTADETWLNDQYTKLQSNQAIDPEFARMLGLQQGQQIGNVAKDNALGTLMNLGPQSFTSANQIASEQQRAYYNALAQLANSTAPRIGMNAPIDTGLGAISNTGRSAFSSAPQNLEDLMRQSQAISDGSNRTITNQQIYDLMNQYGLQNYRTPDALTGLFNNANYESIRPLVNQVLSHGRNPADFGGYAGNSFDENYGPQQTAYNTLAGYINALNNAGYYNTVNIGNGKPS